MAAIIGCAFAQVAEQNLCGSRTDNTQIVFVNDPANCDNYLWCNFNEVNDLNSVHQGKCPVGFRFNHVEQACDAQFNCAPTVCEAEDVVVEEALRVR